MKKVFAMILTIVSSVILFGCAPTIPQSMEQGMIKCIDTDKSDDRRIEKLKEQLAEQLKATNVHGDLSSEITDFFVTKDITFAMVEWDKIIAYVGFIRVVQIYKYVPFDVRYPEIRPYWNLVDSFTINPRAR
jgi:hypothetical protein